METVVQLISNVGFPIAAFLLIYWQNRTILTEVNKSMNSMEQAMTKLTETLTAIRDKS